MTPAFAPLISPRGLQQGMKSSDFLSYKPPFIIIRISKCHIWWPEGINFWSWVSAAPTEANRFDRALVSGQRARHLECFFAGDLLWRFFFVEFDLNMWSSLSGPRLVTWTWIFSNSVHLDLLNPMELENHKNLGILLYHPKIPQVSPHPPLSGPFWGLVLWLDGCPGSKWDTNCAHSLSTSFLLWFKFVV